MVLLVPDNKTDEDYTQWGAMIGVQSELGVHLKIGISYSDHPGPPHVVAEGIVGVPRPPEDDFERTMLANKLAELVEAPDIAVFEITGLMGWMLVRGGPFAVKLIKSEELRELDPSWREVLLDLKARCWVHKTANVLNKLPKGLQAKAKQGLQAIWMAESRAARVWRLTGLSTPMKTSIRKRRRVWRVTGMRY